MLNEDLKLLHQEMVSKLERIRISLEHRGNKGNNAEEILRQFLREFLPPYNRIGHGEVIDSYGNRSQQIDVIVTNEHHPYLNDLSQASRYFCEGVSCAGEVKSVLTSAEVPKILEGCIQFKSLKLKIPRGLQVQFQISDADRFLSRRPYFLFGFESQLTLSTLREQIISFNLENALSTTEQIDAIFILNRGWLVNTGKGDGVFRLKHSDGTLLQGYAGKEDDRALFTLLSWLSVVMPRWIAFQSILVPYLFPERDE